MVRVTVGDEPIALYHTAGGFYATSAVCTHAGELLTDGTLNQTIVQCPKHGGKFDVTSGEARAMPCVIPLETYELEIRGTEIYVNFDD